MGAVTELSPLPRAASNLDRGMLASTAPFSLMPLLVIAALVDWLVTRTLTRVAIYIPKSEAMITGYELISWMGLVGSASAALLALVCLAWIVREEWRARRIPWIAVFMTGLAGLSLVFLIMPPAKWLPIYYLLMLSVLLGLALRTFDRSLPPAARVAALLPALVMLVALLYQAVPALYTLLRWSGSTAWSVPLFQLGEVLVVAGAGALWWAYGRQAQRSIWLMAISPPLLFSAVFLAESAMTATIVVWSNGLTLFLPWWLYAGALWLTGVTILWNLKIGRQMPAWAILLLMAAGYAPQLSSQFFFGLIALWLLTNHKIEGSARAGATISFQV
jgi:hypothetical protein